MSRTRSSNVTWLLPRRPLAAARICLLSLTTLALTAHCSAAATIEGDCTIYTVSELVASLSAAAAAPVRMATDLGGDHPVVWNGEATPLTADLRALEAAVIQSGLRLASTPNGWTLAAIDGTTETRRAEARLLPAAPIAIALSDPRAITSGGAVVFGQWITAPYRVDADDEAVRLNGVPVFPSPGAGQQSPRVTAEITAAHDALDAALALYDAERSAGNVSAARANLITRLLGMPEVSNARWQDDLIRINRHDGTEEVVTFDRGREPEPLEGETRRAWLREQAEQIESTLRAGRTVLFGATYLLVLDGAPELLRSRIAEVRASAEPEQMKIARLQAHTHHRDAASDLVLAR
ncbi:MAG: hypothetical protein IPK72_09555 [Candidatus Eisenbacteria bacterium]|nr:hypothetical protein [Candidatus Eisenbacteria bacterium]